MYSFWRQCNTLQYNDHLNVSHFPSKMRNIPLLDTSSRRRHALSLTVFQPISSIVPSFLGQSAEVPACAANSPFFSIEISAKDVINFSIKLLFGDCKCALKFMSHVVNFVHFVRLNSFFLLLPRYEFFSTVISLYFVAILLHLCKISYIFRA